MKKYKGHNVRYLVQTSEGKHAVHQREESVKYERRCMGTGTHRLFILNRDVACYVFCIKSSSLTHLI